jgi:hypothetical protein
MMTTFARKSFLAINPIFEGWKNRTESERWTTQRESRRSSRVAQPEGPTYERLTQFAPVLFVQLYLVFFRGGFYAFPGRVAFSLGHSLHLREAGDCVAHVSSVMNGFFTFLGKCEVFIGDMIAASVSDLGHAS